ncbi:MAG: hypothetical protein HLUCCA24_02050 [Rhodobacteraceae bacterium HLUCCA24]|nr:MAG: hypothetical protein HLUCCA24_02050 [Rhodobacteraceae bacterium HLUCCA24]
MGGDQHQQAGHRRRPAAARFGQRHRRAAQQRPHGEDPGPAEEGLEEIPERRAAVAPAHVAGEVQVAGDVRQHPEGGIGDVGVAVDEGRGELPGDARAAAQHRVHPGQPRHDRVKREEGGKDGEGHQERPGPPRLERRGGEDPGHHPVGGEAQRHMGALAGIGADERRRLPRRDGPERMGQPLRHRHAVLHQRPDDHRSIEHDRQGGPAQRGRGGLHEGERQLHGEEPQHQERRQAPDHRLVAAEGDHDQQHEAQRHPAERGLHNTRQGVESKGDRQGVLLRRWLRGRVVRPLYCLFSSCSRGRSHVA